MTSVRTYSCFQTRLTKKARNTHSCFAEDSYVVIRAPVMLYPAQIRCDG